MVNGVEVGRQVKQGQNRSFTLVRTNNDIVMYFQQRRFCRMMFPDCNELDRWLFFI